MSKNGGTVATLYFVWKGQESESKELRASIRNNDAITVVYALDETAPANSNYLKKEEPSTTIAFGGDVDWTCRLLAEEETTPRPPVPSTSVSDGFILMSLKYLKFGLKYTLTLELPIDKENSRAQLLEAKLSATIADM